MKNQATIVLVLLAFLTGFYSLTNRSFAQLLGWQYMTPITVYENSGVNLTSSSFFSSINQYSDTEVIFSVPHALDIVVPSAFPAT